MIASALKKASCKACASPAKSMCRRAACTKIRTIPTWETDCFYDLRAFSCNQSLWSSTRTILSVQDTSAERQCPGFRCTMRPSSIICNWNSDKWSWKDCTSQNWRICSASDCIGIVWRRDCSKHWETKQPKIEGISQATCWSDDEKSKLQSTERNCGWRSKRLERKVGECFQWQRNRQCARGDSCSFTHDSVSGNTYESHRRKDQSSSPAPDTEGKTDGQKQLKRSGSRGQSLSRGKGRFLCLKNCDDPSCDYWHPPMCQNYLSENGCS